MQQVVYQFVHTVFLIYMLMLMARILSSWFIELQDNKCIQFIAFCTDPYLNLFRRLIPPLGVLDISPIVAFFALGILEQLIKSFIR